MSRFHGYRDSFSLCFLGCVLIPRVSGLILALLPLMCPDSTGIGTHSRFSSSGVSRFSEYRDSFSLCFLGCVPILRVLGLILALLPRVCPDSPSIGTHSRFASSGVSRFSEYRDSFSLCFLGCVPIPRVSGLILALLPRVCPDSPGIETRTPFSSSSCLDSELRRISYFHSREQHVFQCSCSKIKTNKSNYFSNKTHSP